MKKSRPGNLLTVLSDISNADILIDIIFNETTTSGVRMSNIYRKKLNREIKTIDTKYGKVDIKLHFIDGRLTTISPEYEDCAKIADKNNLPLKDVYREAMKAAEDIYRS